MRTIFLRSCLAALVAAAFSPAAPADPLPASPSQQLQLFQTCAGRLSAVIEHQWLTDPAASDRTEAIRDEFDALVEAVLPDAIAWGMPREMSMHWRITEKAAQARLLLDAAFATEPVRAARAREAAARRLAECDGVLIF